MYYTALLINVGCHSDAHEQAKWFGDHIALKSGKYDHEFRSVRGAVAGVRRIGSGHPVLRRFRVGLEFALSGHRDMDGMIAHHAAIARSLGEQPGLPDDVLVALGGAMTKTESAGLGAHRQALLAEARGDVLEIGAGTGTNLPYYGGGVRTLTFTEPEKPMVRRLQKRILERRPDAKLLRAPAEGLPFNDDSFDTVVATLVLCTVDDQPRALGGCGAFCARADGCCSSSTSAQTARSSPASRTA